MGAHLTNGSSIDALNFLLAQKRFDLIFKYLYVKDRSEFNINAYIESIRAFNGFHEQHPSDGRRKDTKEAFIEGFNLLIDSIISKGFDKKNGKIPIGRNGEITDGAHRLATCAALGKDIEICIDEINEESYPYSFFRQRGMAPDIMDYGALEYVKINPNAYIVNIHSINNPQHDVYVEQILEQFTSIYYKKEIKLNLNGYVNLKKLSYGSFWEEESTWIGNNQNGFAGAYAHAVASMGKFPLRVYVVTADNLEKIKLAKAAIRDYFGIGNFSIHINDTHEEAIWLAETYFNKNSIEFLSAKDYRLTDFHFEKLLCQFRQILDAKEVNRDKVCLAGSAPLNAYGIRSSADIDYLSTDIKLQIENEKFSSHDDQLCFYPFAKEQIINNPKYHFYFCGLKIISLDVLLKMKMKRAEYPKDFNDCKLIRKLIKKSPLLPHHTIRSIKSTIKNTPILRTIYRTLSIIKRSITK